MVKNKQVGIAYGSPEYKMTNLVQPYLVALCTFRCLVKWYWNMYSWENTKDNWNSISFLISLAEKIKGWSKAWKIKLNTRWLLKKSYQQAYRQYSNNFRKAQGRNWTDFAVGMEQFLENVHWSPIIQKLLSVIPCCSTGYTVVYPSPV